MRPFEPAGLRGRLCDADEIDQLGRGAPSVEHLHEIRQRVPPVVAGRCRQGLASLVQLVIEQGDMLRDRQRAEVAEALDPQADWVPAVREAHEFTTHLLEVSLSVIRERVALTGRQRSEARPQFVPAHLDGQATSRLSRSCALVLPSSRLTRRLTKAHRSSTGLTCGE